MQDTALLLSPPDIYAYLILIIALVAVVFINLIPPLSYPLRLFFTMIHEIGHIVATRFSEGEIVGFWVFADDSGVAVHRGGDVAVITPAGYLGTPLFSASLILLCRFPALSSYILGILGGTLTLMVLTYGKQSRVNPSRKRLPVTWLIGLSFGAGFIGIAWFAPLLLSIFSLYLLALQGAYISLKHLNQLTKQARHHTLGTDDASQMSTLKGCSPLFWTRLWFVVSFLILTGAIWFTWIQDIVSFIVRQLPI